MRAPGHACAGVFIACVLPSGPAHAGDPPVAFPHPLITEVLFDVPDSAAATDHPDAPRVGGDATGDGNRDAAGDEFVEIHNPHDKKIRIRGYTISDRNAGGRGALRFTFPDFWLHPGQTAVVFNGLGQSLSGPVGGEARGPDGPHEAFGGGFVFSMRNRSSAVGLANGGDWVLLTDPQGRPVHCVYWGSFSKPIPEASVVERVEGTPDGSVSRESAASEFTAHILIDGRPFSPGEFAPAGDEAEISSNTNEDGSP